MRVAVAILAHQEERRIATCLESLPLDRPDAHFIVVVNGSTDATATIARRVAGSRDHVSVLDWPEGGKSRSWNRLVHDSGLENYAAWLFVDGDAQILPGACDALVGALRPGINAAAGMPRNGRGHLGYQQQLREQGGLFGDLYALSGSFMTRIRAQKLRLPEDLIGDDGLIAALAMTDLGPDANWDKDRIVACEGAGFLCEPVELLNPRSWAMQGRRMGNYSLRYFQNRIISDIMAREGPAGLPSRLADLYPQWLDRLKPRPGPVGWFDRRALATMRAAR